ncbi:ArsR/SmtB family transcription factor [Halobacillus campisalis]|uniref:ArsR/SmtB family transcription factor n=1 Tax=Halobacillus campisalis TaxID=435909 RepID=A0ABW2K0N0_9BACI|nr:metalloregulator ArsR/SmtB family transcription factor [Halobacillus campisalis]
MTAVTVKRDTASTVQCMKAMSDPTRLLIMKLVQKKAYCVCQFVDMFEMSQPAISQHLRKLKMAGLVREERRGQWRFFSMNDEFGARDLVLSILNQLDDEDETLRAIQSKEKAVSCD